MRGLQAVRTLRKRFALQALLLPVLTLRALLPIGVMPDVTADGAWVQLCTTRGLESRWMPSDPVRPADPGHGSDSVCLYALAAAAPIPGATDTATGFQRLSSPGLPGGESDAPITTILRTQSARAPPART